MHSEDSGADPVGMLEPRLGPDPDVAGLRQCVLAVCVLDDLYLTPLHAGVLVHTSSPQHPHGVLVAWEHVAGAIGEHDPLSTEARSAVARLLRLTRTLSDRLDPTLRDVLRPVGLPAEHVLHPGHTWLREVPMGCALGLGLGLLGVEEDPDAVTLPPAGVLESLGIDLDEAWQRARGYLDEMGAIAATRLVRNPLAPLRPMGDCDVITLLGSAVFRSALIAYDGVGVRALAAPMRRRGWVDPDHVDAVFARAAAFATAAPARGFTRPVLVTRDGVWDAVDGDYSHALELAMRDERQGENQVRPADRYFRP